MVRSTFSAAVLLAAVAGLTGCTTTDANFKNGLNEPVGIVAVPQSDLFQWYYRHEAMQHIRENDPYCKDRDIVVIKEAAVPVGQRIDQPPPMGPDGKPLASLSAEKEYQIMYKRTVPINKVTVGPAPTMSGLPNNGMPMNTVVPAGGVQNVNPQYSGTNTNMPPYGGVQNVNTMQPNSQMMAPANYGNR